MWTVIYIAANKNEAEKYQKALAAEGILTKLRPISSSSNSNKTSFSSSLVMGRVILEKSLIKRL